MIIYHNLRYHRDYATAVIGNRKFKFVVYGRRLYNVKEKEGAVRLC